jgi:hypothetical protein
MIGQPLFAEEKVTSLDFTSKSCDLWHKIAAEEVTLSLDYCM